MADEILLPPPPAGYFKTSTKNEDSPLLPPPPPHPLAPPTTSILSEQDRKAKWGSNAYRADGTLKDNGFLGVLKMKDGSNNDASEISIGVEMDGKETEIPTLVPTLAKDEIDYLLSGKKPTPEIISKATDYAKDRMSKGLSPFYSSSEKHAEQKDPSHPTEQAFTKTVVPDEKEVQKEFPGLDIYSHDPTTRLKDVERNAISTYGELHDVNNQIVKAHGVIESTKGYQPMQYLTDLYSKAAEANSGRGAQQTEESAKRINDEIERVRKMPVSAGENTLAGVNASGGQVENKTASKFKTYGDMFDATIGAHKEILDKIPVAREKNDKLKQQTEEAQKLAGYTGKDIGYAASFGKGFGDSMDNMAIGLSSLFDNDEGKKEMFSKKFVMDNILYQKEAPGASGRAVETLGGVAPYVLGTVGTGGEALAPMMINSMMMGLSDYGGGQYEAFIEAKQNGTNDDDAIKYADKIGIAKGLGGVALGGALPFMDAAGEKLFLNPLETNVFKKFAAGQGIMAPAFGGNQLIQNIWAKEMGSDRDVMQGVPGAVFSSVAIGGALHAVHSIANLPQYTKDVFNTMLAKRLPEVEATLKTAVDNKLITPQDAEKTLQPIQSKAEALKVMPKMSPEIEQETVPLIEQKQALVKQEEGVDEAFHPPIDKAIKGIDSEIKGILDSDAEDLKDRQIVKIQAEFNQPASPEILLSDEASKKLSQIDKGEIVTNYQREKTNAGLQPLLDGLNENVKRLTETRDNPNRRFSREQIDNSIVDLKNKINAIEDARKKEGIAEPISFTPKEPSELDPYFEKQNHPENEPDHTILQPISERIATDEPDTGADITRLDEALQTEEDTRRGKSQETGEEDAAGLNATENRQNVSNAGEDVEGREGDPEQTTDTQIEGGENKGAEGGQASEDIVNLGKTGTDETKTNVGGENDGVRTGASDNEKIAAGTETKPVAEGENVDAENSLTNKSETESSSPILPFKDSRFLKSSPDSINAAIELFGDNSIRMSIVKKGFDDLNGNSQRLVMSRMFTALHDAEIFDSVVKSIPVDVMNDFIGEKDSTQKVLHDKNMLMDRFSVSPDKPIPSSVSQFINSLYSNLGELRAFGTTKNLGISNGIGVPEKDGSTEGTRDAFFHEDKDNKTQQTKKLEAETGGKEQQVRGKDKIARGLDKLNTIIGGKKNLIGDEQRPTVIDALKDIGEGLIEEGIATGANVIQKIREYLGGKMSDEDFDSVRPDIEKHFTEKEKTGKIAGISNRVMTEVSERLGITAPERGEGIDPKDVLPLGKELLASGADPKKLMEEFHSGAGVTPEGVAIIRAKSAELTKLADDAMAEHGKDSQKSKDAAAALQKFNEETKPYATKASNVLKSYQGATDVDTGSFISASRAWEEALERPLNEKEAKELKEATDKVNSEKEKREEAEKKIDELKSQAEKAQAENEKKISELEKKGVPGKKYTVGAKKLADQIRSLKTKPFTFTDKDGNQIEFKQNSIVPINDIIEGIAKAVEAGGKLADKVKEVLDGYSDEGWYKNLDEGDKERLAKQLTDHLDPNDQKKQAKSAAPDIHTQFVGKIDSKYTPREARDIWKYTKENYLRKDVEILDAINKTAKDLSQTPEQIYQAIASDKTMKRATDDLIIRQRNERNAMNSVKELVKQKDQSPVAKTLVTIFKAAFTEKVLGHGGVAMFTHANPVLSDPRMWSKFFPAVLKANQYAYEGLTEAGQAKYERSMSKLVNRPNWKNASVAGLRNDPYYNSSDYSKAETFLGRAGEMGKRGFSILPEFRQDMFDHFYNNMSNAEKADPNVIKAVAKQINNATGWNDALDPKNETTRAILQGTLFSPKLLSSAWAYTVGEPAQAIGTYSKAMPGIGRGWSNIPPAERVAANMIAKRVGITVGTYAVGLAINQGLLSATGSKQQINFTHPSKPDFLKNKDGVGDVINLKSAELSAISFIAKLFNIWNVDSKKDLKGKTKKVAYEEAGGDYIRSRLSPGASDIADVATSHDFEGNTMPWSHEEPDNKYAHKLTWTEYLANIASPIPVEEGIKNVAGSMREQGVSDADMSMIFHGIAVGVISMFTGVKISNEPTEDKLKRAPIIQKEVPDVY